MVATAPTRLRAHVGVLSESGWLALGFVVAFGISLLRLPLRVALGTLWAEDGTQFVHDAYLHGLAFSFFRPYAGYMHAVPRLVGWLAVTTVPLPDFAIAVNLLGAAVHAALGVFTFTATRAHFSSRWISLLTPLFVVACPVGPETVNGIANIQWSLLATAFFALLWSPRRRIGVVVGAVVILLAATSSPFGFLLLPVAIVRLWCSRSRGRWAFAAALAVGAGIQWWVISSAHRPTSTAVHPVRLLWGYTERVVGDGTLGLRAQQALHASLLCGSAVLAAVVVLGWAAFRRGARRSLRIAALALAASAVLFAVPVTLAKTDVAGAIIDGRYYVPAAIVFAFVVALLCDSSIRSGWLVRAVGVALPIAMVFGVVTSYHVVTDFHRSEAPSWSSSVRAAREACQHGATDGFVNLPISPRHWAVALPCRRFDGTPGSIEPGRRTGP